MSTATEQLRERWGRNRLHRAMHQAQTMMEPHLDKMETERGMWAMVMLAGAAILVSHGLGSQSALDTTIKQASKMTDIPEDALAAHVRFCSELVEYCKFDQQQNETLY